MGDTMSEKEVVLHAVNINDDVRIRLTEYGLSVLDGYFANLNLPNTIEPDEDGYYTMQLWDILNYFGDHTYMGCRQSLFDNKIEFMCTRGQQKIKELRGEIVKCKTQLKFFSLECMKDVALDYDGHPLTKKAIIVRMKSLENHIKNIESGEWED